MININENEKVFLGKDTSMDVANSREWVNLACPYVMFDIDKKEHFCCKDMFEECDCKCGNRR